VKDFWSIEDVEKGYEEWMRTKPPQKDPLRYVEWFVFGFIVWTAIAIAIREIFGITLFPL